MMTMIKKWYLVLLILIIPISVYSQEKDFGIWYGISLKHELRKKLNLEISPVVRTFDKASKIDEEYIEAGLEYKLNKNLSTMASYRLTNKLEINSKYYFQHKVFLDLKGSLPVSNFSFSCRLRLQVRTKTYIENANDMLPDYTGRVKLKAVFKTPGFPVNPYIYVETFSPLFINKDRTIEKSRYAAGMEFKISKRHSVEAEYIFQRDFLPHISDINVISICYNLRL